MQPDTRNYDGNSAALAQYEREQDALPEDTRETCDWCKARLCEDGEPTCGTDPCRAQEAAHEYWDKRGKQRNRETIASYTKAYADWTEARDALHAVELLDENDVCDTLEAVQRETRHTVSVRIAGVWTKLTVREAWDVVMALSDVANGQAHR